MAAVLEPDQLRFRPMLLSDLPDIMGIEVRAYPHPWTRGIFRDCLRVGYCCWVGESEGAIRSYGVMSITIDEAHILNVCVRQDSQGRGYGRATMQHLISLVRQREASTVILEVRPSNRAAILLYESMGFRQVGLRKSYYPAERGREDAMILVCELGADGNTDIYPTV
jgi:ribosomal-protein-alanine N-acetyltransferase